MPEHKQSNIDQMNIDQQDQAGQQVQPEPTQTAHGDQAGEQGAPGNNRSTEGENGRQSDVTPD